MRKMASGKVNMRIPLFAYREVYGCIPPQESRSKMRLYWRMVSENKVIFFVRFWLDSFKIWSPCDSYIKVISGGSKKAVNKYLDRGVDNYHEVIRYIYDGELKDLHLILEVRDHRSYQIFTQDQLSNFTDEQTEEYVEDHNRTETEGSGGEGLEPDV